MDNVDAIAVADKVTIVSYELPAAKAAGIKIEDEPEVLAAKLADWLKSTAKVEVVK